MPDGSGGEYRRRRRTVRWLIAVTAFVVLFDGAAGVLTIRSTIRTAHARSTVSAVLRNDRNLSAVEEARLDDARHSASQWQAWATRAEITAFAASGLLLLVLFAVIREYLVTERARHSSREAQLDAERLNAARSVFLSRVSHELRTPLGAILGFGQLLEREPLEPGQRETLEQMLTGGRHLIAIVDDLLDLSRVQAGELRLVLEPVQVKDAIAQARSMVSPAAASAAVGIRLRPVDPDLLVIADPLRLQQVLLNLLSNAVKYNRRGGNIAISASVISARRDGASMDGGRVRIEVQDTGVGIASEAIELAWQPFERLEASRHGIEGTGLGLPVARGLVEAMGGTLGLSSEEGVGTTAWLELPAARPAPGKLSATGGPLATGGANPGQPRDAKALVAGVPGEPLPGEGTLSVLYIEDNLPIVRLVEKIFALAPELSLSVAADGATGLAKARELSPDLILLDLQLPDTSGEQVLIALQTDRDTAAIPVLIVSAEAAPDQVERLRSAGAIGFLTKPFDVDQLLRVVRACLAAAPSPALDRREGSDDILDGIMVKSLHTLAGNPAVGPAPLGEMLVTFRRDAAGILNTLHAASAEGDMVMVARDAHRLAGGAGAVGAGRFRRVCRDLEDCARQGREADARVLDGELDPLMQRTWDAISAEFASELQSKPVDIGESTGAIR